MTVDNGLKNAHGLDNIGSSEKSSHYINTNKYRNLYVVIEIVEGVTIPVNYEMLGEARRLMDSFNIRYHSNEKVIALVLGENVKEMCNEFIYHGADAVIYADNTNLKYLLNQTCTKVISQMAVDKKMIAVISPEYASEFEKPRYMFFAADSIGRHLSATVLAELDSGLASDVNKLSIADLDIKHQYKTNGQTVRYEKILEMYRPDFSGFLWTTILCLDNKSPEIKKDYHPQACSIIPGAFIPIKREANRRGIIVEYTPKFDEKDLRIKILNRTIIKDKIDFDSHKIVISFGRGIKENPEENIKLIESLAKLLKAEIGISLPISKKIFPLDGRINSTYIIPSRVIGTSGRKITPKIYISIGISGAIQHLEGMKESEFVIAINPDENAPIINECDVLIRGKMEDVIPVLMDEIKRIVSPLEVQASKK